MNRMPRGFFAVDAEESQVVTGTDVASGGSHPGSRGRGLAIQGAQSLAHRPRTDPLERGVLSMPLVGSWGTSGKNEGFTSKEVARPAGQSGFAQFYQHFARQGRPVMRVEELVERGGPRARSRSENTPILTGRLAR